MIIIFKTTPPAAEIQANEIEQLLYPLIKGHFWQKSGELKSLRIIEVTGPHDSFIEYHCICEVFPPEVTLRVIENLNGKSAFGVNLVAQEYTVRNPLNDPRKTAVAAPRQAEQRKIDRRRMDLTLKAVHK